MEKDICREAMIDIFSMHLDMLLTVRLFILKLKKKTAFTLTVAFWFTSITLLTVVVEQSK